LSRVFLGFLQYEKLIDKKNVHGLMENGVQRHPFFFFGSFFFT